MPDPITTAIVAITGGTAYTANQNKKAADNARRAEEERLRNLNSAVAAKEAEYQSLADAYNTSVDSFNTNLSNTVSGLGGFANNISGLSIADLYDNPATTAINENAFDTYMSSLNNIENQLGNLKFNATRPSFSSVITTPYGTGQLSNIPTLNTPNTQNIYGYQSTIDDLQNTLYGLNRQRENEIGRIDSFFNDLDYGLSSINRSVGRLGIADTDALSQYEDDLAKLESQYRGFSSPILNQWGEYGTRTADLLKGYEGINEAMEGLRNRRAEEETRISNYENDLRDQYNQFSQQLSGYDIRNENELNNLLGSLDNLYDEARGFDSELQFDFSDEKNDLTDLYYDAQDLLNDRQDELRRIEQAQKDYERMATGYNRTLDRLGIADLDMMNELGYGLEDLQNEIGGFSSLLDYDFSGAQGILDQASGGLGNLRQARTAEEQRIADYLAGLQTFYNESEDDFGGYNISNIDGMNQLQDLIDARQKEARQFRSELDFDFTQPLDGIQDLEDNLGNLFLERDLELGRIEDAQRDYLREAQSIDRLADSTGIYSKAGIDALQQELDALNQNIGGFTSLLDFDFSGTDANRAQAQSDIDALLSERASALDAIQNPISGYLQDLGGLELYDESGMFDVQDRLGDLNYDLSRFSGGRTDEIQGQITSALGDVDTRLKELADYRGQLEQRAQEMQAAVEEQSFYGLGDLTDPEGNYDSLNAEVELYNARQAMDEIDGIMQRLYSERNRLETDAQNVAARRANAQSALLNALNSFGLPQFDDLSQVDPMTMQEFLALISAGDEEDDQFTTNPNAFSSNVIRVG